MAGADSLELAAARLRVESNRLEDAIASYLEPSLLQLPEVWIGPAADQLERDLLSHRLVLRGVARGLRAGASRLEWEAAGIRAAAAAGAGLEGVAGAL
ncbi:MAG: hypothetical protein P1T08_11560 [Acidimicrobiia bacterium]|nr:hypothetical protein [Acidimicrobiia bacterium]